MTHTWLLRSERIVFPEGLRRGEITVENGLIARIDADAPASPPHPSAAANTVDVGNLVVMPGLVDSHVHVNEPGRTDWEGFVTATQAAASGGVTSLVDMPLNCLPVTTTKHALDVKLGELAGKLHVDVGFWGGVIPGNAGELGPLAKAGVLGCKAFMVHSGIDEFPNATEADLRQAMPILRDHGVVLLAHAEVDLGDADGAVVADDGRTYASYLRSRPRAWENEAIRRLIALAEETRCPVHVVHLSSADALPMLAEARARGVPITAETCPHYLCFDAESVPTGNTLFKCAPPIREGENRERLWKGLADGIIDFVVTDHSPCTAALKKLDHGNFHEAWGGVSSLSLGLSAVWTEAKRRGYGLEDLTRWMCERPAKLAGLGGKGHIAKGCDADFVVWDPDASFVVEAKKMFIKNKQTPYEGRTLFGVVDRTYVRGACVFDRNAPDPFGPTAHGKPLLGRSATR